MRNIYVYITHLRPYSLSVCKINDSKIGTFVLSDIHWNVKKFSLMQIS